MSRLTSRRVCRGRGAFIHNLSGTRRKLYIHGERLLTATAAKVSRRTRRRACTARGSDRLTLLDIWRNQFGGGYAAWRDDPQPLVDRSHLFANGLELRAEPESSDEAHRTAEDYSPRRADGVSQASGKQAAQGSGADEGHGVEAHHAAAHFFIDQSLNDGVTGSQSAHHAESGQKHC